jgi:hypothetical protein
MTKHLIVADERHAQISQIAETLKVSITEALGLLIGWAVESGKIAPPGIPGFAVTRKGDTVIADLGGITRTMSLEHAEATAGAIRLMAGPEQSLLVEGAKALVLLNPVVTEELKVKRRGTSIKITGDDGQDKTLSFSIALEVADMIRAALK